MPTQRTLNAWTALGLSQDNTSGPSERAQDGGKHITSLAMAPFLLRWCPRAHVSEEIVYVSFEVDTTEYNQSSNYAPIDQL